LKRTASDVKEEMVWPQPEMSNSLKLIPLQLVPESNWSYHRLKLMASLPTGHERPQSVKLTTKLLQRALYVHHKAFQLNRRGELRGRELSARTAKGPSWRAIQRLTSVSKRPRRRY